ncbi:Hypothetical protein, putative [Bodo saltans]|uniref:Reverse transcriptase domain-containing protein n=1 Tax=Bodo saltans TaxID=75058 RepID=A0A0S4IZ43_BODSA|nr:Hypothetical protein, putative [Bodo saltans]|eukprot:CUF85837.1 Hypothetical protein, putative [Bodo saltans]
MDPLCTSLDQHLLTVPGMGPRHHRGVPRNLNHRWCGCLQYADDGVLWLSGADVDQLLRGANDALVLVADFYSREGIALSTKSTALLIGAPSPTTPMSVVCGNLVVEVRTGEVTERVLGAFFDTRLNMTQHVERAVARAHKVLACIASIRRLLSPATTRELVFGAALSPAIYAAAAFGSLLRTTAWHLLDTLVHLHPPSLQKPASRLHVSLLPAAPHCYVSALYDGTTGAHFDAY